MIKKVSAASAAASEIVKNEGREDGAAEMKSIQMMLRLGTQRLEMRYHVYFNRAAVQGND